MIETAERCLDILCKEDVVSIKRLSKKYALVLRHSACAHLSADVGESPAKQRHTPSACVCAGMGPWSHACVLVPRVGATPRWHEALACLARHRYAKLTLAMNAIMLGLDFVPFTEAYAPHGGTLSAIRFAYSQLHVAPCMSRY